MLVIILTLLMGLFMQFDMSVRFHDASGQDSLLGLKVGFGRGSGNGGASGSKQDGWDEVDRGYGSSKETWLEHVETGVKYAPADQIAGMADAKIRWDEEGAPRTEVLAHAPGKSLASLRLFRWADAR